MHEAPMKSQSNKKIKSGNFLENIFMDFAGFYIF